MKIEQANKLINKHENEDIPKINSQLEQKAYKFTITPEEFGAKGDGIADDTEAINKCVAYGSDLPTLINFSKKYKITNKIKLNSNTILNLNNSLIIWANETNVINGDRVAREHWNGIFDIEGEKLESCKIISSSGESSYVKGTNFIVENASLFNVGDFVAIDINRVGNQSQETYKPCVNILCKILKIVDNIITVDFKSEFDLSQATYNSNSLITKINPKRNIIINDINISNIVPWYDYTTEGNVENFNGQLVADKMACGVGIKYATNIKINNIYGKRIQYPLVMSFYAYDIEVNNPYNDTPSFVASAQGYCVKIARTKKARVNNPNGFNCRHIFDASMVDDVEVNYGRGINTKLGDFDLHGICEQNVIFNNCNGEYTMGNGWEYFPMLMKNITIENSKCKMPLDCTENLLIKDSEVEVLTTYSLHTALLKNCKVKLLKSGDNIIKGATRNGAISPSIKFDKYCKFDVSNELNNIGVYLTFFELDNVEISNGLEFKRVKGKVKTRNVKELVFINGMGTGFVLEHEITKDNFITNVIFDNYKLLINGEPITENSTDLFGVNTLTKGKLILTFKNNSYFNCNKKEGYSNIVYFKPDRVQVGVNVIINSDGTIFDSNGGSYLEFNQVGTTYNNTILNIKNTTFSKLIQPFNTNDNYIAKYVLDCYKLNNEKLERLEIIN